jgi:hypothetical protein
LVLIFLITTLPYIRLDNFVKSQDLNNSTNYSTA